VTIQKETFDEVVFAMSQRQQIQFSDDEQIPDEDMVTALQRLRSDVQDSDNLDAEIARLRGALNVVGECLAEMETRLEKHLLPLPPGPEGDG
jgi:outer membrane protein assembly factor BamA